MEQFCVLRFSFLINGLQYLSEEFSSFAQQWEFTHKTSSPRYPKSNGKAESVVKTCKNLRKKVDLAKTDVYLSLLDRRNTPTEQTGWSPAQRLFGRRTQTLFPLSSKLLEPVTPTNIKTKLISARDKQASYYNQVSNLNVNIVLFGCMYASIITIIDGQLNQFSTLIVYLGCNV